MLRITPNGGAARWLGKARTQTSDNDRLKRCKTNFKLNPKPRYCVAYVTGCVFNPQQNGQTNINYFRNFNINFSYRSNY